jgi:hypothetical protein
MAVTGVECAQKRQQNLNRTLDFVADNLGMVADAAS